MTADTPTLSPADRARVDLILDVVLPYYLWNDALVLAERERITARYEACKSEGRSFTDSARTARAEWLTATVAALVAEAEARGREAGAKVCESRAASHRGDGHRGWAGEAEDCALAIRSATPTPTPHAPGCQSRFPMRGAPLPCNCAGHRDEGEGAE